MKDLQAEWSALLFDALAASGVTDLVISPGSRSTPFVLAALAQPRLRCAEVIDERSAGFYALGLAKAYDRPTALLCTSGSAGAHYFPAVIEAQASHTPLVVLTADRPLELQGCAAPQTIDQVKLFSGFVRGFFELGDPQADVAGWRGARRTIAQAVLRARWPEPGPVHLNLRARKPLEPRPAATDTERSLALAIRAARATPLVETYPAKAMPSDDGLEALAGRLARAERPLFVCGPGPLSQTHARGAIAALASHSGAVVLAEAGSQLRFGGCGDADCFEALLSSEQFRARATPDLVLQLGAPATSTALERWLDSEAKGAERWVAAPHGWNDPDSRATGVVFGALADIAAGLSQRPSGRSGSSWPRLWREAETIAEQALDEITDTPELSEPAAVRTTVRSLAPGEILMIGNSLPIREVDLTCPGHFANCLVLTQRGANGIDGLISGAAGAAASGRRVTLLLGDVSLLHDMGGLLTAARTRAALTVVVLQNHGGRLFEDLPLSAAGVGDAMAYFTTPHVIQFGPAAELYGLAYRRCTTVEALQQALREARDEPRPMLIEAVVPDRGLSSFREALAARLSPSLASRWP